MERATRMLNLLSAVIMTIATIYVNFVFQSVLSSSTMVLLWCATLGYTFLQIELSYRFMRKHLVSLWRF
jgi:hypothetical protein